MATSTRNRYRQLINEVNDAVYTVDVSNYSFTYVNDAAEKLTGYKKSDMANMGFGTLVAPESMARVQEMIQQKKTSSVATIYEIEIIRKDGSRLPVEISSRAVYRNGKAVEILGVARDISERKQLDRQRDIFISLITHELKNPLTTIKLTAEMLQEHMKNSEDVKAKQLVANIVDQNKVLTELIDDFLGIGTMRSGDFTITRESFDFVQLVEDTINSLQSESNAMILDKQHQSLIISADRNRIRQVLLNLLNNAMKYSPKGNEIKVSITPVNEGLQLSVQDSGFGIPEKDLTQIFDLFYRVGSKEHQQINGHGLGLYICKEIINKHGGKIWAESIHGKGSTFHIILPTV